MAKLLINGGNLEGAQEQIDWLLEARPRDAKAQFASASLLAAQSRYSNAVAAMHQAID